MLTRVNEVGVRRLDEWMTMACDLLLFITSPLSQSHAFASCTQASIRARVCVWSVGGKLMYSWVLSAYMWWQMLCFCKSVVSGAMYALNSSGPRTVPCGTPVVMMSDSDTPLFTRTTYVRSHK
ncbi:hypothetical protein NP493_985g00040 [Ridgeia piscesae]|uniref:Uncharacterized protein n=1 Tax=Ridgeia piscesae TaxID=27915 RepID=A0AAD9KJ79_RIDPI|nr:hypothetical protein NP493_985g00040 [Ridgeia piscesae]